MFPAYCESTCSLGKETSTTLQYIAWHGVDILSKRSTCLRFILSYYCVLKASYDIPMVLVVKINRIYVQVWPWILHLHRFVGKWLLETFFQLTNTGFKRNTVDMVSVCVSLQGVTGSCKHTRSWFQTLSDIKVVFRERYRSWSFNHYLPVSSEVQDLHQDVKPRSTQSSKREY